jgi:hypothetical protein
MQTSNKTGIGPYMFASLNRFALLLLALCALMASPAHADSFEERCVADRERELLGVDLPVPQDPEDLDEYLKNIRTARFTIDIAGGLKWYEDATDYESLPMILDEFAAEGDIEVRLMPHAESKFGETIRFLAIVKDKKFPRFGFVGNEHYRKIPKNHKLKIAGFCGYGKNVVTLSVFYGILSEKSKKPQCSVFSAYQNLDDEELVDRSTAFVKNAIDELGGIKALESGDLKLEDLPYVVITSSPDTPWKCIGGVIFNLQMAGFLNLRFSTNASITSEPTPLDQPQTPR